MHIEKLKSIQECLASAAEAQIYDLENVDAQELGEVIDIIKDIEETIYYCTVTKAMKEGIEKSYESDVMYYDERYNGHPWREKDITKEMEGNATYAGKEHPHVPEDNREGKSYRSRKMYMEAKETKQDKTMQMKELEKYAQELTSDVVEML